MPHRAALAIAVLLSALVSLAPGTPDPQNEAAAAKAPAGPPAAELRGRVSAPDDKPVAGATIRILPELSNAATEQAPAEATVAESGEDGTFVVGKLVGTSFLVRVEAGGFATLNEAHAQAGSTLHLRLVSGHTLSGTVADLRSGTPLVGATVTACDAGAAPFGKESCRETKSGEGGAFRLVDLPRGVVGIEALAEGHASKRFDDVAIPFPNAADGSPRRLDVFLSPGARLGGVVLEIDGRPIEGATVELHPQDPPMGILPEIPSERTDAKGRFAFEGVPLDARFTLVFSADGHASSMLGPVPGGAGSDLTMRLGAGATLDVKLVDSDDVAVESIEVVLDLGDDRAGRRGPRIFLPSGRSVDPDQVESLGEGRFKVARLRPGTYTVRLLPKVTRTSNARTWCCGRAAASIWARSWFARASRWAARSRTTSVIRSLAPRSAP